jgi:phospho-N-acetylmuramoyl-pentapeptide-transferase
MLKLLSALSDRFAAFNVFRYLTFRAAYAMVTALLISFVLAPAVIERLRALKFGQSIRAEGPETHKVKQGTPTMGGVLMILSVSVSVLLWQDLSNPYTWIALGAFLAYGAIGFTDDMLKIKKRNSDGLPAWLKMLLQAMAGAASVAALFAFRTPETSLLYIPFFKNPILDLGWAYIPIAVVYLVWWSNAVNLSDGLDGLAGGLSILVLVALALLAYLTGRADWSAYLAIPFVPGSGELTVFALALMGACIGFLWFNSHPAEVFMGDCGSLALGGVFGLISLALKKEILLFVIGGVFILEAVSVVLQVAGFKLTGKRLFKMAPLHHHFELKGWKETQVVTRFWILGGLFAVLALTTIKTQ